VVNVDAAENLLSEYEIGNLSGAKNAGFFEMEYKNVFPTQNEGQLVKQCSSSPSSDIFETQFF